MDTKNTPQYEEYTYPKETDFYDIEVVNENFKKTQRNQAQQDEWAISQWSNKADKVAPTAKKLPLADDFSDGNIICHKNEFGQVTVSGHASTTKIFATGTSITVTVLPEGYKPVMREDRIALLTNSGGTQAVANGTQLLVLPSGEVRISILPNQLNMNYLCFEASFTTN